MTATNNTKRRFTRLCLWLIVLIGVIVPRRLRIDWRREWEAELRYRETLLAEWDRLDRGAKLALLWRSATRSRTRSGYNREDWRTKCFKTCVTACECC